MACALFSTETMSLLIGEGYCGDNFLLLPKLVAILNSSRMASDYVAAREQGQFSVHARSETQNLMLSIYFFVYMFSADGGCIG